MLKITFYSKPDCHLCEDGRWMVSVAQETHNFEVEYCDITMNTTLTKRYSHRIPVLKQAHRADDLGWPFTPEDIIGWLETTN